MITHLELRRFKCFQELKLDPRQITIFIGKNGTGKSSVLQALACLRQSVGHRTLVTRGSLVDIGSVPDVTHGMDPLSAIEIVIGGHRDFPEGQRIGLDQRAVVSYESSMAFGPKEAFWQSAKLEVDSTRVDLTTERRRQGVIFPRVRMTLVLPKELGTRLGIDG